MGKKRKDKHRIVLRTGESYRQSDDRYAYRWSDLHGKRHTLYAKTLDELRTKEAELQKNIMNGIRVDAANLTLNDMYDVWRDVKRGLRPTTYRTYCCFYETHVRESLGKAKITKIKKSDIKRFYNELAEEHGLAVASINTVHAILRQTFDVALDDGYVQTNPTDGALGDLRKAHRDEAHKRDALTAEQEKVFLNYLQDHPRYGRWYPIFAVMLGTGLRVGEVTGLRWEDIDLENGVIDVNHALIYYRPHRKTDAGQETCRFMITGTKTPTSTRKVPMLDFVKDAFIMERERQQDAGIRCRVTVDGFTNFIFVTNAGHAREQGGLNRVIQRVINSNNSECDASNPEKTSLPYFTCHSLRHTFATRMCEMGVNLKVIQDVMGHSDIGMTMNVYTDATKDMKNNAFAKLNIQYHQADAKSDTN